MQLQIDFPPQSVLNNTEKIPNKLLNEKKKGGIQICSIKPVL